MGHMHATEYASGEHCDFDTGLIAHLRSNHFPPVSLDFMPACKEAISFILDGNAGGEVHLPNGKTLTADKIIEDLHLDAFVQSRFFAQENPCDNCDEVWGGMDCAECPKYWKDEAEEGGYFVTLGISDCLHQPNAISAAEALGQTQQRFAEAYGHKALSKAFFKVREAGNPRHLTDEELEQEQA